MQRKVTRNAQGFFVPEPLEQPKDTSKDSDKRQHASSAEPSPRTERARPRPKTANISSNLSSSRRGSFNRPSGQKTAFDDMLNDLDSFNEPQPPDALPASRVRTGLPRVPDVAPLGRRHTTRPAPAVERAPPENDAIMKLEQMELERSRRDLDVLKEERRRADRREVEMVVAEREKRSVKDKMASSTSGFVLFKSTTVDENVFSSNPGDCARVCQGIDYHFAK